MDGRTFLLLTALFAFAMLAGTTDASYLINNINTTVVLNTNTSASVTEILNLSISNSSAGQYTADRAALNFTLSQWQTLIGSSLVEHIVNPKGSIYGFSFIPGPLISSVNGRIALLELRYYVSNVTTVNQTGPRTFLYQFNNNVFNFEHAESGEVLGYNTTLTIIVPSGARVLSVFPVPDSPAVGFTKNYRGVTTLSWSADEPLSEFVLSYTVEESLQAEVLTFFGDVYNYLGGGFVVIIIAIAIALFVVYTYWKVGSK